MERTRRAGTCSAGPSWPASGITKRMRRISKQCTATVVTRPSGARSEFSTTKSTNTAMRSTPIPARSGSTPTFPKFGGILGHCTKAATTKSQTPLTRINAHRSSTQETTPSKRVFRPSSLVHQPPDLLQARLTFIRASTPRHPAQDTVQLLNPALHEGHSHLNSIANQVRPLVRARYYHRPLRRGTSVISLDRLIRATRTDPSAAERLHHLWPMWTRLVGHARRMRHSLQWICPVLPRRFMRNHPSGLECMRVRDMRGGLVRRLRMGVEGVDVVGLSMDEGKGGTRMAGGSSVGLGRRMVVERDDRLQDQSMVVPLMRVS